MRVVKVLILCMLLSGLAPAQVVQPDDLQYLGAFRLPDGPEEYAWAWSGQALAFYPQGDPGGKGDGHPGSLFGVGHDWHQHVSEVSIPKPVKSRRLQDLPTARTLQPFRDIRGNLYEPMEQARAGLAYLPAQAGQNSGKLYFCWDSHMHEGYTGASHGYCDLNLSAPSARGPWALQGLTTYCTSDYLFPIPQGWAGKHCEGRRLATGRFRDGGQGSMGPDLFAIAPWKAKPGQALPSTTLLRYSSVYSENPHTLNNYHHSDEWSGGAWLGDTVVFVGTKGKGKCWYGFANGVVWPEEGPFPPVPDYPNDNRGWWSTSFSAQILFYRAGDLAAVAEGRMKPWQPQPYAVKTIDQVLLGDQSPQRLRRTGGVAYDPVNRFLYVLEHRGDGDKSVVHCWRLGG